MWFRIDVGSIRFLKLTQKSLQSAVHIYRTAYFSSLPEHEFPNGARSNSHSEEVY